MKYDFDTPVVRRGSGSIKWDLAKDNELPMWVADMDFKAPEPVINALKKRVEHGVFGYTDVSDGFKNAYINWWSSRHGVTYSPDDIIFATGVVPIISSCVRKLTTPAENVAMLTPVYNIFFNCVRNNGRNILEVPLAEKNGDRLIPWDALESAFSDPQTTLFLLCNPHNPVGKIWDKETLSRIGKMAKAYGVTVISDEIHCDLTDPGKEYIPFASVSEECRENCVVCVAPTKTFNLAGIQTAAAIVPDKKLRHKVRRALNTDEVAEPNVFAALAAQVAFDECGGWLDELREYIYGNKELVREFLEKNIPELKLGVSEATYLLWIDCRAWGLDSPAKAIREKTGLFLSEGSVYGSGGKGFVRMNVACPRSTVEEGLRRLKAFKE
ncbi:MAG: pyridoxal phosphate-dependent aminotransferase [Clostridia bacterium]|nr:pyridoxal phosphate-dependent aminotransferase [Clostridia bacterium]